MLKMAQHKFASNVCEKALVCADAEYRRRLLHEIMKPKVDGMSPVVDMMKDQFASGFQSIFIIVSYSERIVKIMFFNVLWLLRRVKTRKLCTALSGHSL